LKSLIYFLIFSNVSFERLNFAKLFFGGSSSYSGIYNSKGGLFLKMPFNSPLFVFCSLIVSTILSIEFLSVAKINSVSKSIFLFVSFTDNLFLLPFTGSILTPRPMPYAL
jgi:hypothetical protein